MKNGFSLQVVYIAVAKRAAIDLEPISYPEHFLVRFTASGLEEERFVDVFNGGTLYTRSAMTDASPDDLEPCRPIAVWQRMLNNLLVIFRQHYRDANKLKATLGAMLTLDPSNNQARDLRFRAAVKVYDYSLAREDVKKLDSPEREVESLLSNIDSQKNHLVRSCNQKKFRGDSLAFMCGTVYRHRRHGYIGLITSYDTTCQASTFWQIQMNVSSCVSPSGLLCVSSAPASLIPLESAYAASLEGNSSLFITAWSILPSDKAQARFIPSSFVPLPTGMRRALAVQPPIHTWQRTILIHSPRDRRPR